MELFLEDYSIWLHWLKICLSWKKCEVASVIARKLPPLKNFHGTNARESSLSTAATQWYRTSCTRQQTRVEACARHHVGAQPPRVFTNRHACGIRDAKERPKKQRRKPVENTTRRRLRITDCAGVPSRRRYRREGSVRYKYSATSCNEGDDSRPQKRWRSAEEEVWKTVQLCFNCITLVILFICLCWGGSKGMQL